MEDFSTKASGANSRLMVKYAALCFVASCVLAGLCHVTGGFLSFFLGLWALVAGVAAGAMCVAWVMYVFGDWDE